MSLPNITDFLQEPQAPAPAPVKPRQPARGIPGVTDFLQIPAAEPHALAPELDALTRSGAIAGVPFKITSTAGDLHNVGSLHYLGLALDIAPQDPAQWESLRRGLTAAGYRVTDERVRPTGQTVWTGPHLHVEAATAAALPTPVAPPTAGKAPTPRATGALSPAQGMPVTATQERTQAVAAITRDAAAGLRPGEILRRAQAIDPTLSLFDVNREYGAALRALGASGQLPTEIAPPGFVRGFLREVGGPLSSGLMARIEARRAAFLAEQERRTAGPGNLRGTRLTEPPPEVSRATQLAETAGSLVGFTPSAAILGATVGAPLTARLGPVVAQVAGKAAGVLMPLLRAGTEGMVYGTADALLNHYDELKQLAATNPGEAAKRLGLYAGLTGAQFAAFAGIFEGIIGAVRVGSLLRDDVRALTQAAARLRAEPETLPAVPIAPEDVGLIQKLRARQAAAAAPPMVERGPVATAATRAEAAAAASEEVAARRARLLATLQGERRLPPEAVPQVVVPGQEPPPAPGQLVVPGATAPPREPPTRYITTRAGGTVVVRPAEGGPPPVATPSLELPPGQLALVGPAEGRVLPGPIAERPAAPPRIVQVPSEAAPPTPTPPPAAAAPTPPSEVIPPPAMPAPTATPEVIAALRARRARKAGVYTQAQIQGDAVLPPLEQRAPVALGRTTTVSSVEGTKAKAQFALVEADAPLASHDARTFQRDPAYPQALQRRERARAFTPAWLTETTRQFNPDLLGDSPLGNFGAPLLGKDGVVEAGNGRMLLLRRLYAEGRPEANAYRTWLEDHAPDFGLSPDQVTALRNPVLVRIRRGPVADRALWAEQLNVDPQAAMSDTETALRDAGRLTPELLTLVQPSELAGAANRPFVRAFADVVVPSGERNRFVDAQGNLSQAGAIRVRNALFARAYGGDELSVLTRITEATDDNVRNLGRALVGAAPTWARIHEGMARGELHPQLDLVGSGILQDAINKYAELKGAGAAVDVRTYLEQGVLLGEADVKPGARELIAVFQQYGRSAKKLQAFMEGLGQAILDAGSPQQTTLLGAAAPPTLRDVIGRGIEAVTAPGPLFEAAPPRTTPEMIASNLDEFLTLPKGTKAAIAQALDEAGSGKSVKSLDAAVLVGRDAYRRYQTAAPAGATPLTQEWFEQHAIARYFGEPGALAAATLKDPRVPLDERIDAALADPEATVRQLTPKPRRRGKGPQPPAVPPIAGGGGEQGRLYLRVLDEAANPTRALGQVSKFAARGWLRESNAVVERMGPEGRDLVRRWKVADREATLAEGAIQARVDRVWEPGPTRAAAFARLRIFADGTEIQLTARETALWKVVGPYLHDMVDRARNAAPAAAEFPPALQGDLGLSGRGLEVNRLEHYWPIMLDLDLVTRNPKGAVLAIMQRTGADARDAEIILNQLRNDRFSGRPFGNLERPREKWAPYEVRISAEQEFFRYVTGAERRVAQARKLGPNDELVNALIGKLRLERGEEDAAFVRAWFQAVSGQRPREVALEGLARQISGMQTATKMPVSVISNASQTINNLLVGDLTTFARTWRKLLAPSTHAEMVEFAKSTGAVFEQSLREVMEATGAGEGETAGEAAGRAVITKTGFMTVEGGNRIFSAAFGREWANDLAEAYVARLRNRPGPPFIGWWRRHGLGALERHMRDLDLDPATILDRSRTLSDAQLREGGHLLTVDEQRLAGLRMVEITQFRPSAGELPLFWDHPWGRVLTQFKRFAYKQGQLIARAVVGEALHGNLKPLLVFLAVFPIVGEGVADIRLLLRHGASAAYRGYKREGVGGALSDFLRVIPSERPRNVIERGLENLAYVGGAGLASDLIRALEARSPRDAVASVLGGPSGSDVLTFLSGVGRSYADIVAAQAGKRTTFTGPRQLARQAVGLTVTPGLTAAFGLPGAVVGKAIESSNVLRSPDVRRRELAGRIADAIARRDQATARQLQQQYRDEFGQAADVGAILRARRAKPKPRPRRR